MSTTAWTNLGSATACASDSDPCTDDVCVSGTCGHPQVPKGTSCGSGLICLASGACAAGCDIGGTVYASGSKDPSNPCLVCTPSRSTSSWSQVAGGTSCDDGNLCNGVDTCQNGSCTQTTAPVTCNAPPTCKVSAGATCAPQTGSCSYPDASMGTACGGGLICDGSGGCVAGCDIGGRFYASGALDPAATCQACVPSSSTTAWSPAPNNTGCGTGSACCGGTCISVSTCNDCGSCGNSCFTGDICKSGSCAPTCFVAGTPIRLAGGGTRAIEAVRVGDEVLGYDTATGRVEAARVLKTFLHPAAATPTTLVVNGHLRVTPDHPFYAGGAWVRADHLRVGDMLLEVGAHGAVRPTPVVSITRVPGGMRTYNLEVAGVHDYFAGGVLVHNKPVGCP